MTSDRPIGIFDSGIGGLTVARAITDLLPNEDIIYFGDTLHLPYGDKSPESIRHFSEGIASFLIQKNCKLIVIACNTASALAYDLLIEKFGHHTSIVNVIDPVVEGLSFMKEVKKIGVVGTQGTIRSQVYPKRIQALNPAMVVESLATPLLAPMIEAGFYQNSVSKAIIERYLENPMFNQIDALVLACTHYPLVKPDFVDFFQGKTRVFDSTDFVARKVQEVLRTKNLLSSNRTKTHHFYVSDFTESFEKTTRIFYREAIHLEFCHLWNA